MKKIIAAAVILVVAGAATAQARVDFNVNIDIPVAAPMPARALVGYYQPQPRIEPMPATALVGYYPQRPPAPVVPQLVFNEPPRFIYSPNLGFHVSVGIPYDIAYLDGGYYLYRGGSWYLAPSYRGPWSFVPQRRLPAGLRQHRYEQVRHFRDREYRTYLSDRDHYRGTWYRPGGDRRVERRDGHRDGRWGDHRDDRREEHGDNRRDGRGERH